MTKFNSRDRKGAMRELEESLRRLRTDHIDVWQFHSIEREEDPDWIFSNNGAIEAAAIAWHGEFEELVAKSSSFIAYQLAESKQVALGHELLDETLAKMKQGANIAALLKVKAFLYKLEGKLLKAVETLERAVDIEERQGAQQ